MRSNMRKILAMTLAFIFAMSYFMSDNGKTFAAKKVGKGKEIVFADCGWDSVKFHNAVAGYIAETLYGYKWREVPGSSTIAHEALISNEVDVSMEEWTDNLASYDKDVKAGKIKELGINFADNKQGLYVPRYVIEGDKDHNIKPLAPDLEYVWDLEKYPAIFKDPENPSKGRIYGAIPGWEVDSILYKKYQYYKLDNNYNYFRPGSDSALSAALTSAYDKKQPIVAYYWEPTWLMGKYDFVLLKDKPYNEDTYKNGESSLPSVEVTVATSNKFYKENPEMVNFLKKYKTSSDLTSKALAHMQDTGDDYKATAKWFLKDNPDLLKSWLNEEDAKTVLDSLNEDDSLQVASILYTFPFTINFDVANIDKNVREFSARHDGFFGAIRSFLMSFVTFIQTILNYIPWFVLLIGVYFATYITSKKHKNAILYVVFMFLIGMFGLWSLMNETLAIVIASVLLSLLFGFPLGVLISTSKRANSIIRPILDTMQTMPVFVYLIPALLFFGLGKAPAVIATTIYAIVPMIRLTAHGIRQIDKEIVEAAQSFGSTKIQSLIKVEIPQALPTIMTGVNQTIMMAMSMVVTTSMIGATGLGMEVLISVNRVEIGRGLISGIAVVIVAIILDRITQGIIKSEVSEDE